MAQLIEIQKQCAKIGLTTHITKYGSVAFKDTEQDWLHIIAHKTLPNKYQIVYFDNNGNCNKKGIPYFTLKEIINEAFFWANYYDE
jgi:hypothetical protein